MFRNKLENAEVIPDASVNAELMNKLGRKEFLRFNPSKFNIYYFGMIIASRNHGRFADFFKPGDSKEQPYQTLRFIREKLLMLLQFQPDS